MSIFQEPPLKEAFTVSETLAVLAIGRSTLYREIAAGRLTPRKLGKKTLFLRNDLRAYLDNLPSAA